MLKFWQWPLWCEEMQAKLWWGLSESALSQSLGCEVGGSRFCVDAFGRNSFTRCKVVFAFR
jgi:hypothetical protein